MVFEEQNWTYLEFWKFSQKLSDKNAIEFRIRQIPIGSLEIPRIFLVSCERAEYFPHFSGGIQNRENEQAYLPPFGDKIEYKNHQIGGFVVWIWQFCKIVGLTLFDTTLCGDLMYIYIWRFWMLTKVYNFYKMPFQLFWDQMILYGRSYFHFHLEKRDQMFLDELFVQNFWWFIRRREKKDFSFGNFLKSKNSKRFFSQKTTISLVFSKKKKLWE